MLRNQGALGTALWGRRRRCGRVARVAFDFRLARIARYEAVKKSH